MSDSETSSLEVMRQFLGLLAGPGQAVELRAKGQPDKNGKSSIYSGVYDDLDALTDDAEELVAMFCIAVWVTLNPTSCEVTNEYARCFDATKDKDITARRWFVIDVDSKRAKDTNSTAAELEASGAKAMEIKAHLTECGFPEPVVTMSGNGYHLLYRADWPLEEDGEVIKSLVARDITKCRGRHFGISCV